MSLVRRAVKFLLYSMTLRKSVLFTSEVASRRSLLTRGSGRFFAVVFVCLDFSAEVVVFFFPVIQYSFIMSIV